MFLSSLYDLSCKIGKTLIKSLIHGGWMKNHMGHISHSQNCHSNLFILLTQAIKNILWSAFFIRSIKLIMCLFRCPNSCLNFEFDTLIFSYYFEYCPLHTTFFNFSLKMHQSPNNSFVKVCFTAYLTHLYLNIKVLFGHISTESLL